jgi:hypothetical protein
MWSRGHDEPRGRTGNPCQLKRSAGFEPLLVTPIQAGTKAASPRTSGVVVAMMSMSQDMQRTKKIKRNIRKTILQPAIHEPKRLQSNIIKAALPRTTVPPGQLMQAGIVLCTLFPALDVRHSSRPHVGLRTNECSVKNRIFSLKVLH